MADGFRILEKILRFAGLRHGLIISNIANVDTPGYRTKDIEFKNILDSSVLELKTSSERHIAPIHLSGQCGNTPEVIENLEGQWKDGNNVELDREIAKLTENALLFEGGLTMLSIKIRMFKNALRRQL